MGVACGLRASVDVDGTSANRRVRRGESEIAVREGPPTRSGRETRRRFRVIVAGVSCEETGLLGSRALADSLDLGSVSTVVNVDGAGRARNLRAYTHTSDAVERVARETVEGTEQPLALVDRPHPYSDHWPFLRAGVPALQLHSEPPEDDGSWGPRGLPVAHTRADTLDKVEIRDVREHAGLCALLVEALARADPPRVDPGELAERLREAGAEAGMRAAGVWPDGW